MMSVNGWVTVKAFFSELVNRFEGLLSTGFIGNTEKSKGKGNPTENKMG